WLVCALLFVLARQVASVHCPGDARSCRADRMLSGERLVSSVAGRVLSAGPRPGSPPDRGSAVPDPDRGKHLGLVERLGRPGAAFSAAGRIGPGRRLHCGGYSLGSQGAVEAGVGVLLRPYLRPAPGWREPVGLGVVVPPLTVGSN